MAEWQRELNLLPEWNMVDAPGGITKQQMAEIIAQRLAALEPFVDFKSVNDQRDQLVDTFEGMAGDETLTTEEFDFNLNELYDWGDTPFDGGWNGKKACWVRTF